MIIPKKEEALLIVIHCPICDKYYAVNTRNQGRECLVAHAPGSCCHFTDTEITKEKCDKMLKVLEE